MAVHRISIFGPMQDAPARKTAGSVRLAPTVKNDVFLNALLEMPTTQQTRRSPLKWLSAMGFHIVIVAALIIVPLYTMGPIHLNEYHEILVVAPPPPLAPPPAPAGGAVPPHITHPKAKLNYALQKLTAPTAIPKNVPSSSDNVAQTVPGRCPRWCPRRCSGRSDWRSTWRPFGRNGNGGADVPSSPTAGAESSASWLRG